MHTITIDIINIIVLLLIYIYMLFALSLGEPPGLPARPELPVLLLVRLLAKKVRIIICIYIYIERERKIDR